MMRCRLFSRTITAALAAIVAAACEEAPVTRTAPSEAIEVEKAATEAPCPRFYFYKLIPDRAGDDKYCARILEECMGPDGLPREGCV